MHSSQRAHGISRKEHCLNNAAYSGQAHNSIVVPMALSAPVMGRA